MPEEIDRRPHFVLENTSTSESFTSPPSRGSDVNFPARNRQQHGARLLGQVATLKARSEQIFQQQEELGLTRGLGIRIHFEGATDADLPVNSLSRENMGIELLNVRVKDNHVYATVFVPEGKLEHFEKLLSQYLTEETAKGNPKNLTLINSIEQIREAAFSELWTDDSAVLPDDENQVVNWEIWLPVRDDRLNVLSRFREQGELLGLDISGRHLEFPERTVVLVRGTKQQIVNSAKLLDNIAEIRRVKETAEFFFEMPNIEQHERAAGFLERISIQDDENVYVAILDTGANNGHPLIDPILDNSDMHSVDPSWGVNDSDGHGTGMVGLAVFGDLTHLLASAGPVEISHRVETVKILRQDGDNANRHHGDLTTDAVAQVEVTGPDRKRIFCMAVASKDFRDRGRPSAWSAAIDSLASGATDDTRRLIIVSAGNVPFGDWPQYPDSNSTDGIHDPGQSWNAITVGAYTDKVEISAEFPECSPLAAPGGMSPHSTTSQIWQSVWPLKPDVVFEGGNVAVDANGPATMGSMELLTTHYRPQDRLFDYFNATSAATALASRMAAKIGSDYPNLWPESIRALMVHSASWTDAMREMFLPEAPNKSDYERMIRHCGFGVPSIERALWSAGNHLTLIAQDELQPFWKDGTRYKSKDMNLHSVPWPRDSLIELGAIEVRMRVTLAYYVEPNPSERGFVGRYRYPSHGLRFDVRRADETEDEFRARINRAARDEDAGTEYGGDGGGWLLGKQKRHRGSLHSDVWIGTAADLANRQYIAVYPTIGWWRERHQLERYTKKARYSLVVSIETPETEIDIYTEVEAIINIPIAIEV